MSFPNPIKPFATESEIERSVEAIEKLDLKWPRASVFELSDGIASTSQTRLLSRQLSPDGTT